MAPPGERGKLRRSLSGDCYCSHGGSLPRRAGASPGQQAAANQIQQDLLLAGPPGVAPVDFCPDCQPDPTLPTASTPNTIRPSQLLSDQCKNELADLLVDLLAQQPPPLAGGASSSFVDPYADYATLGAASGLVGGTPTSEDDEEEELLVGGASASARPGPSNTRDIFCEEYETLRRARSRSLASLVAAAGASTSCLGGTSSTGRTRFASGGLLMGVGDDQESDDLDGGGQFQRQSREHCRSSSSGSIAQRVLLGDLKVLLQWSLAGFYLAKALRGHDLETVSIYNLCISTVYTYSIYTVCLF